MTSADSTASEGVSIAAAGSGPLAGVTVVELGRFASAPSCATVLADWGADVVKVEPLSGDPARGPGTTGAGASAANPRFDVHNRSRRSIAVDLATPAGAEVGRRLLATADVFVTNLRTSSLGRLNLDPAALREQLPHLVVAHVTGYPADTSWADERSFDHGAFWSYSGVASMFVGADGEPPQPTGGLGDRAAGSMLAGGVCAALLAASRTGQGAYVSTSLVRAGLWLMASDVSDAVNVPGWRRRAGRLNAPIPTLNSFKTSDGRWVWLQVMVPEQEWPRLLAALEAGWLDEDPRFRGGGAAQLAAAREPLIEAFDEVFRRRSLAEWTARLSAYDLTWAPVRGLDEVVADAEIRGGEAFVTVLGEDGVGRPSVNTSCSFAGYEPAVRRAAPGVGADTVEVLRECGYSPVDVESLARRGVVGGRTPAIR